MVVAQVTTFEGYLIEILLSIILMFNVGAYSFLWRKIRDTEASVDENNTLIRQESRELEGELDELRGEFFHMKTRQQSFEKTIYGSDKDSTDDGFITDTESKIDCILETVEESEEQRKEDYNKIIGSITFLADEVLDKKVRDFEDIQSDD